MRVVFHLIIVAVLLLAPQSGLAEVPLAAPVEPSRFDASTGELITADVIQYLPPVNLAFAEVDPASNESIELVSYNTPHRYSTSYGPNSQWQFGRLRTIKRQRYTDGSYKALDLGFVARGFYQNDQRIQWSGLEATFAGEGALYSRYRIHSGDWITSFEGEFFLNQPSDENILIDTQERRSYLANYDFDPFELSRLNVAVRNGDWQIRAGKMWTPFGRYYSQLWSNQLLDAPFIRTESIRWRETGFLVTWDPGAWVIDAGLFNGHLDRDANSAKALVARVGRQGENWACGASVKLQDGSGSENQKTFSRYAGVDAMIRQGRWRLSSEVIYDQYGLRKSTFDPLDIFWEKSIYYRDINEATLDPIEGVGYYLTVDYTGVVWTTSLSFGQFFPEYVGNIQHDRTQTRGILKVARSFGPHLQAYSVVMKENEGYIAQVGRPRRGTFTLAGLQLNY